MERSVRRGDSLEKCEGNEVKQGAQPAAVAVPTAGSVLRSKSITANSAPSCMIGATLSKVFELTHSPNGHRISEFSAK